MYPGKKIFLLFSFFACMLHAETIWEDSLIPPAKGWNLPAGGTFGEDGLSLKSEKRISLSIAGKTLPVSDCAGRILTLSAEVKGEAVLAAPKPYEGAKIQFTILQGKKRSYAGVKLPPGTSGWKTVRTTFYVPGDASSIELKVLFQNSGGKISVRNLKLNSDAISVNVASVANMGLADTVAEDGKGGWTDQGPKLDGRNFRGQLFSHRFAGIPFHVNPDGKNVLTMRSKQNFPAGPAAMEILVTPVRKARMFYLLHTLAWAGGPAGTVVLTDDAGKTQEITVRTGIDAADWYRSVSYLKNGYPGLRAMYGHVPAAVYVSRFPVDPRLGGIRKVSFKTNEKSIWLILGASLSLSEIPLPAQTTFTVKAGDKWKKAVYPEEFRIQPGSALDLTAYMPVQTVDEMGRVVIRNGHFELEKEPGRPLRFLAAAITPNDLFRLPKDKIAEYIREVKRNGYNMIRTHFLDAVLMKGAAKPLEFNPKALDAFDFMISEMKKNGLYLNFDLMTSWIGYTPGNIHKNKDPLKSFKSRIAFDPAVRENWTKGVEKILTRVNPYTKMRLADDPVLMIAVGFNEQEFGFWDRYDETLVLPRWRAFLKRRYGTIDKLKKAWGEKGRFIQSFETIPAFKPYFASGLQNDAEIFRNEFETAILDWYRSEIKRMGCRCPVTGFNCGKSQTYNVTRRSAPYVAINGYHAHPNQYINRNSTMTQRSPSEVLLNYFRGFVCVRQPMKPLVVTEHNVVFWNRHRYEQAFATGAYSALQDFDALTCHATPVNFKPFFEIQPFALWMDPVMKANEFLTFFLFVRRDIEPAKPRVRIRVREEEVMTPGGPKGALPSEQSLLALITGVRVECIGRDGRTIPLRPGEMAFKIGTTDAITVNTAGFSNSVDNPAANAADVVELFRRRNLISPSNRSDGRTRFESENGQLFLDAERKYISVDTPRFQGVCATEGTSAKLSDFEIKRMTVSGNLALVSIDALKPIRNARRMMLVYSTNALNDGMTFTAPDMTTLYSIGRLPAILECGAFEVEIRHETPSKLRMHVLDFAGKRTRTIRPSRVSETKAVFAADSARDGATFFYEITVEP